MVINCAENKAWRTKEGDVMSECIYFVVGYACGVVVYFILRRMK